MVRGERYDGKQEGIHQQIVEKSALSAEALRRRHRTPEHHGDRSQGKSNLGEGGNFRRATQITVTQDGNNLTAARVRTNQDGETTTTTEKFTLDGKECTNDTGRGPSKAIVTWSADGKALNFAITRTFDRNGETTTMKSTEVWTLTDANTLSILSTASFQGNEMKTTLVYDKK